MSFTRPLARSLAPFIHACAQQSARSALLARYGCGVELIMLPFPCSWVVVQAAETRTQTACFLQDFFSIMLVNKECELQRHWR